MSVYAVLSDSAAPWATAHQAPLSVEFSRQEYWSSIAISYSKGSARLRDQTDISYINLHREPDILYHCTTLEVPVYFNNHVLFTVY